MSHLHLFGMDCGALCILVNANHFSHLPDRVEAAKEINLLTRNGI